MFKIKKTFSVSTGHRLSKHKGLCQNIHGHNLKIIVTLKAEKLDNNDMVMDFHTLSELMKPLIDSLDHSFLVNSKDDISIRHIVENRLKSFVFIDCDPTAEMLAKKVYDYLVELLAKQKRVQVDKVEIYENDGAVASYKFKLQIIE
jgi:6-pyruvoyltetrahydropterin/6-carboxytetrahydropterin synthase